MNMKILTLLTFCILLLSTTALAAVTIPDTVTFEADYSRFDDDRDQELLDQTVTLQVTNPDAQDAQIVLEVQDLPAGYNAINLNEATIEANSTKSVTFTIQYPHEKDGGKSNVGKINVKQNGNVVDSATLVQDTRFMLIIDKIRVDYEDEDGKNQDDSFDSGDGDTYELDNLVRVGSEVTIEIKLENEFQSDYREGDIDNIDITIEADDSDLYEDDFDEDAFEGEDLDAGDKGTYETSFVISNDVDEGTYTLEITITGEDGSGAKYDIVKEIELEIERERDQIRITKAQAMPSSPRVCDTQFSYEVEIENTGTDDQREARITVESQELGINEDIRDIELQEFDDRDNDFARTFNFKIPARLVPGTYPIEVRAYYDEDKTTQILRDEVVFQSCAAEQANSSQDDEEEEEETEVVVSTLPGNVADNGSQNQATQSGQQGQSNNQRPVVSSVEQPYTSQDVIIAAIIIAVIIIVTMIVVFFMLLFKR